MAISRKTEASRRERQLLEALYRIGPATAADLQAAIANPPTYTAVRTHLSNLQEKGLVRVDTSATKYVYQLAAPREDMAESAVGEVLKNFFEDRVELLVASLLDRKGLEISQEQLDEIEALIQKAREEGR